MFGMYEKDIPKEPGMDTAKVFWSGRSQAVRLPKEYRFDTHEVRIRRHGNAVILEPAPTSWDWLDALSGKLDSDAAEAAHDAPAPQDRPAVDRLFD
jgi:antitoxin VapB